MKPYAYVEFVGACKTVGSGWLRPIRTRCSNFQAAACVKFSDATLQIRVCTSTVRLPAKIQEFWIVSLGFYSWLCEPFTSPRTPLTLVPESLELLLRATGFGSTAGLHGVQIWDQRQIEGPLDVERLPGIWGDCSAVPVSLQGTSLCGAC